MMPYEKCPICGGEMIEKNVEKLLRGGVHTASVKVRAEVCSHCGERLYAKETVKYFEQILSVEPNNCDALKSLGYAYFGGVCTKNYTKALRYLLDAEKCISADKGACGEVDLLLWIAQCYHLRAADKLAAKQDANDDFKNSYNWYGRVLKCEPNHAEAKKGHQA